MQWWETPQPGDERFRCTVWQAASLLLAYPDSGHRERLDLVERAVADLPPRLRDPLGEAITRLREFDDLAVQTNYVDTFDLKRKRSLFLTYWTDGDTRGRGNALLGFLHAYRDAGVTAPQDELPDHLAVVLEFAATVDAEVGALLLGTNQPALILLHDALAEMGSPYAAVVEAVLRTVPDLPEARAEAARIAAQGPPAEAVGLTPYQVTVPLESLTASLRNTGSLHPTGGSR